MSAFRTPLAVLLTALFTFLPVLALASGAANESGTVSLDLTNTI